MDRRQFSAALPGTLGLWLGFGLGVAGPAQALSLSEADAASGVRAALERGAAAAVSSLGRTDGFLGNDKVRIPLPQGLAQVAKLMKATGQQKRVDELVTAMNRAAEAAVPEGKVVLVNAVKALSIQDALGIVKGGDNAVTEFFAKRTRTPLSERFLPIVTQATQRVNLAERYNSFAAKASTLGLVKGDQVNLQKYVTGKALDGLYLLIGEEEKRIRADPVRAGSALLKKVFGG